MDNIYFSPNGGKPPKKLINKSKDNSKNKKSKDKSKRSKDIKFDKNYTPKRQSEENISKKSKKKVLFLSLTTFFVILALLLAIGYGLLRHFVGDISFKKKSDNPFVKEEDLLGDKKVTNILLLGADKDSNNQNGRSDTMMLMSINEKTKEIKLVSFLRDSYVTIPNHGKTRLNHAYMYGKAPLVINTIEYNYNIDIDNYVLVNFDAFMKVVDAIGGVDVPITKREAMALNKEFKDYGHFESGNSVHLNGQKALAFSRIRHLDSDFKRTNRQRIVINAIIQKVQTTQDKGKLLEIAKVVMPMVETDMKPVQISRFAMLMKKGFNFNVDSIGIPADGTYQNKTINGMAVLVPDLNKNKQILKDFLYDTNTNTDSNSDSEIKNDGNQK